MNENEIPESMAGPVAVQRPRRDKTLAAIFEEQVRLHPDAIAVSYGEVSLTYAELSSRANRLARFLRSQGVRPGSIVAFSMPRSIEAAVCVLAIVKSGGAYLPLDPEYPPARLSFMLADAGAKQLFVATAQSQQFTTPDIQTTVVDDTLSNFRLHDDAPLDDVNQPEDIACVLYTSGSSSEPKGVMIRNTSIVGHVCEVDWIEFKATDRIAQISNLSFDPATSEFWGAWLHGAALVILPVEVLLDSSSLGREIRERNLSVMFIPAGLLNIHAARDPSIFGGIETLASGGEPANPGSFGKLLHSRTPPKRLLNVYGPTEATTQVTYYEVPRVLGAPGTELPTRLPIGKPVTGCQCLVLDPALKPVAVGEVGELYLGGRPLAAGYLNRPELTAERFVRDPDCPEARLYRTGDLVRWRLDGNLEFLGRADDQIKLRDYRIEPGEIQSALGTLPGIEQSYVTLMEDRPGHAQLVAYLVYAAGFSELSSSQIRKALRRLLPLPMLPDAFVSIECLPLTPNRKVDRKALPAPGAVVRRAQPRAQAVPAQPPTSSPSQHDAAQSALLPTDWPRRNARTVRWSVVHTSLEAAALRALRSIASEASDVLDDSLLGVWQILLARWSGRDHARVAIRRTSSGANSIVDVDLVRADEVLIVRTDFSGSPTFADVLKRVHQGVALSANAGQVEPDVLAMQAAFAVSVVEHEMTVADAVADRAADVFVERGAEIILSVRITRSGAIVGIQFREDLFERNTAEQMLRCYVRLLAQVATAPSGSTAFFSLLSGDERAQLLGRLTETEPTIQAVTRIHELFEQRVRICRQAIALVQGNETLTYDVLNLRANQLAHHLRSLGVVPDSIVGICVSRTATMVVAILAVLKAGGAYLPLDPEFPHDRVKLMLEDSSASILLTESTQRVIPATDGVTIVCLDQAWGTSAECDRDDPTPVGTAEDIAYVIYTSGSTGRPNGVMIPHLAAVNFLTSMQRVPGISIDDRVIATTTLSFDIALLELMLPLISGATVIVASSDERMDPMRLSVMLDEFDVTVMQATPTTWNQMVAMGWKGRRGLRALVGGEPLRERLADELLQRCSELWNMYGPTETTVWSTCWRVSRPEQGIFLGTPIANTRCVVLDENQQLVPVGVYGELCIGGSGLARGYLNRDELTSARFIPDPHVAGERLYRTGDLARWRSSGLLEFSRRVDRQVKVRGFRIELGEIEAELDACEGVDRSLAVVREDRPGDRRLVAYVVGKAVDSRRLRERLSLKLHRNLVPSEIVVLDEFPLTPSSKLDVEALPKPDHIRTRIQSAASAETMDPLQCSLAAEWEETLNVRPVGLDDDFFELGGNSLLALSLLVRIAERFGRRLALASFLEAPTVRAQANLLRGSPLSPRRPAPVSIQVPTETVGSRRPLFFASGWGGPILSLRAVARAMGPEQPLYLLDYLKDAHAESAVAPTIESIASRLIDEIRAVQATGPYQLAGYSLGAKIVYEIARQLHGSGEIVSALILLDSYAPGHPKLPPFAVRTLLHIWTALKLGPLEMWPYLLKYTIRLRRLLVEIKPALYEEMTDGIAPFVADLSRQALPIYHAALRYRHTQYSGKLMLIRAGDMSDWGIGTHDDDPTGGWAGWVDSAVCVGSIPCTHTRMLDVEHANALARLIKQCFELLEPISGASRSP
jgi:amino acid adenylation domain-containing protein